MPDHLERLRELRDFLPRIDCSEHMRTPRELRREQAALDAAIAALEASEGREWVLCRWNDSYADELGEWFILPPDAPTTGDTRWERIRVREMAETSAPAATRSDSAASGAGPGTPNGDREGRDSARHRCPTCGSDDPAVCVGRGESPHPHVISKVYPKAFYNCCPDDFHNPEEGQ